MLGPFKKYFEKVAEERPNNPYLPLLHQSLANAAARFHTWDFLPETTTLDPESATADQLHKALDDCWRCIAVEYPETEGGTYYALKRAEVLQEALLRRFPAQASEIVSSASDAAWRAAKRAHSS